MIVCVCVCVHARARSCVHAGRSSAVTETNKVKKEKFSKHIMPYDKQLVFISINRHINVCRVLPTWTLCCTCFTQSAPSSIVSSSQILQKDKQLAHKSKSKGKMMCIDKNKERRISKLSLPSNFQSVMRHRQQQNKQNTENRQQSKQNKYKEPTTTEQIQRTDNRTENKYREPTTTDQTNTENRQ